MAGTTVQRRDRRVRLAAAGTVLVLSAGGLAACSGGGGGGSSADTGFATSDSGSAAGGAAKAPEAPEALGAPSGAVNRTVVETRARIRTGELVLTSRHLDHARAEVDRLVAAFGGTIDNEQTTHRSNGSIERSTLVVRVPAPRFDAAMTALGRLGTKVTDHTSSEDVTQQVIDVRERLQTLQNSLDRLQKFQRQAADVADLLRFEQEITQREAEIQSLTAQRDYLADQTTLSTITLTLERPAAAPPGALDDAGFLAGLRAGWDSLVATVVVMLTVTGAVLPFGGVLLLLGVPAWLLLRRSFARRRTAEADAADATDATAGA